MIHLLTRDRIQHVTFSTLRFFAKGARLVVRRKKFQELLLLLTRVALTALLVFVFARPFFGAKAVDTRHEYATAKVVVLDVSSSMRRAGLPDALKKEADAALASLSDGQDQAGLITFADTPTIVVPLQATIAPVRTAADAVQPGYGGTNIAEALRKAGELLDGVRAKQKEIVLVSDLQRRGWSYFKGDWKLAGDVKLTIRPVKPGDAGSGLGIVELSAPGSLVLDQQPSAIAVRIANYSYQPKSNVPVTLWLGGKQVDAQQVNLRGGGTAAVRFRHVFATAGDNPGSIVVGSDASTPDNTVYFNARVIPRIPVLLVDGRPSARPADDAAFFLDKALVPTDASPFIVTTLATDKVTPRDVAGSSVVILANVGAVAAPVAESLQALLNRGGGVFLLPGDQVQPEAFNAELGPVAPCRLRQVLDAHPANGETAESLTRIDFDHPIFDVFSLPHHGDLTNCQNSRTIGKRPIRNCRGSSPASAMDARPSSNAVSARGSRWRWSARSTRIGTTSPTNRSSFLLSIRSVRYLAVQTGQQTAFTSGDPLPVPAWVTR